MIEASKVIADIIQTKLSLEDDQIWLRDENIKIPEDERLYISIGMIESSVIGNNNKTQYAAQLSLASVPNGLGTDLNGASYFDGDNATLDNGQLTTIDLSTNLAALILVSDGDLRVTLNLNNYDLTELDFTTATNVTDIASILDTALEPNVIVSENSSALVFENEGSGLYEKQIVSFLETIQIDLLSRSTEARDIRYELLSALTSVYSVQKQEENNIKIFRVPSSFINSSEIEGGSRINRYTIRIECNNIYVSVNQISDALSSGNLYEKYPARVDDEDSIGESSGIIEFTLEEE